MLQAVPLSDCGVSGWGAEQVQLVPWHRGLVVGPVVRISIVLMLRDLTQRMKNPLTWSTWLDCQTMSKDCPIESILSTKGPYGTPSWWSVQQRGNVFHQLWASGGHQQCSTRLRLWGTLWSPLNTSPCRRYLHKMETGTAGGDEGGLQHSKGLSSVEILELSVRAMMTWPRSWKIQLMGVKKSGSTCWYWEFLGHSTFLF